MGVVGGTKVNNTCVKASSEGSEVSQRIHPSNITVGGKFGERVVAERVAGRRSRRAFSWGA